jgi:excisionase family DNA binding protein
MMTPLLDITGMAKYLNVPVKTIYGLVQIQDFPAAKIGKRWLSHPEDLEKWARARLSTRLDTPLPN